MAVVRFTTPTFKFTFKKVDVSDIVEADLVVKQWENTIVEKDFSSATVDTDENALLWTLTQAEAGLLLTVPSTAVYLRASFRTGGAGMMCAVLASEITPYDYWSRDIDEIAFVNAIESDGSAT